MLQNHIKEVIALLMQTHSLIGHAVALVIQEKLNITLNKEAFQYGSIKPDFYPNLMLIPHYKESSSKVIYKRIQDLQNKVLPTAPKALKEYSLELGVINHFMADYFCGAHNQEKKSSLPNHLMYELDLAKGFSNSNLKEITLSIINNTKKTPLELKAGIIDYINKKHLEYLNRPTDTLKDILYSLELCIVVSSEILMKSLANITEKIA